MGGCLIFDGDKPVMNHGQPHVRMVIAPASSFQIIDTWHSTGLAGSGSSDYAATELFIPEERTFGFDDRPYRDEPLYAFGGMILANMAAVPLGLARRAIDAVLALAGEKQIRFPPPPILMKDAPHVRMALARAEMLLGAARAYTYETLDAMWEQLQERGELSPEMRLALSLSRIHAFQAGHEVARLMYDTAGPSAIYASSILDRLLRDAVTMSQHLVVKDRAMELSGAMMLGQESLLPNY
jgi:alkylation response protein AidB-like acyl-CoA dehydrogenase